MSHLYIELDPLVNLKNAKSAGLRSTGTSIIGRTTIYYADAREPVRVKRRNKSRPRIASPRPFARSFAKSEKKKKKFLVAGVTWALLRGEGGGRATYNELRSGVRDFREGNILPLSRDFARGFCLQPSPSPPLLSSLSSFRR